jgi:hypothetical protein
MLPIYSFSFLVVVGAAIFFYRAAVFEDASTWIWTGLSVVISIFIWQVLHGGLLSLILGQVGLFVGIGIFRMIRKQ